MPTNLDANAKVADTSPPIVSFAVIGTLIGSLIGFLARPVVPPMTPLPFITMPSIGQLPFEVVLTRGSQLKGDAQMLVPYAQSSFNTLLIGAILGLICGAALAIFAGTTISKASTNFMAALPKAPTMRLWMLGAFMVAASVLLMMWAASYSTNPANLPYIELAKSLGANDASIWALLLGFSSLIAGIIACVVDWAVG